MEKQILNSLIEALQVRLETNLFENNFYVDESFFLESIRNNFAGWYEESALVPQVEFILRQCRIPEGGAILDLACGHGRHADLFAQRGYRVTGRDVSSVLITHLDKTYSRHNLAFELGGFMDTHDFERFHLAIVLGNSLSLVPRGDAQVILKKLHASLKPGGRLFLELDNRDYFIETEAGRRDWSFNAGRWLQFSEHIYDPVEKLEKTIDTSLDLQTGKVQQYRLTKSLYDRAELTALCTGAGLKVERIFGNWQGDAAASGSASLLLAAVK